MHKGVLAYFVILVLMVVVALFLSGFFGGGEASTTTTTTAASTATTTVSTPVGNNTTTSQTTTSITISPCQSNNAIERIYNGDFSAGTFAGWNSSAIGQGQAPGFGTEPFNLTYANENGGYYDLPWSGYDGSYFATTYHNGLLLQAGNITSAPFKVDQLYLNFKIISPQSDQLYVEILQNNVPKIVAHYNTYAAQTSNGLTTFVNASMPLVTLLCQNVSIRVYAGVVGTVTNKYNYIAVGDFYKSRVPQSTPGIVVNQTIS